MASVVLFEFSDGTALSGMREHASGSCDSPRRCSGGGSAKYSLRDCDAFSRTGSFPSLDGLDLSGRVEAASVSMAMGLLAFHHWAGRRFRDFEKLTANSLLLARSCPAD